MIGWGESERGKTPTIDPSLAVGNVGKDISG